MNQLITIALPPLGAYLVLLVRVGGILAGIPLLGSRSVPMQIKAALVVVLALALLPLVDPVPLPQDPLILAGGLFSEFLIGMVLGLAIRLVFAGIELAGELMGTQMGLGVVQLFDPTASQPVPIISQYQTLLASMIFLAINAHFMVVEAIAASYQAIPSFGANLSGALTDDVLHLSRNVFILALKVAAPVMATILLINLLLAVLGRAVSQINVFLLSFPITISAGFLILGLSLPFTAEVYRSEFIRLEENLDLLLRQLGHG